METPELNKSSYFKNLHVAIYKGKSFYLDIPPFNPHKFYPEYIFKNEISSKPNTAYDAVRSCFFLLGLDRGNFSSYKWNPLKDIIKTEDIVVIKPNFVQSSHYEGGNLYSIITHPSVLRAVVDYVYKAINGEGEIIIADAPQMDCNFKELLRITKLNSIQDLYWKKRKFEIKILDLRDFWVDKKPKDIEFLSKRRKKLPGDPLGSIIVNLSKKSEFYKVRNWQDFYGADYNRDETIKHHRREIQEYMVSNSILDSDVLISVPKLKVHKKVGVTLNSKGLVGINTNKNYLIHYTLGSPEDGGDQYPSKIHSFREAKILKTKRILYDFLLSRKNPKIDSIYIALHKFYKGFFKQFVRKVTENKLVFDCGNWYGNDSAWRMVSDLMKIIIYVDKNGIIKNSPQRKVFSVVDGIIGGENNGPLIPDEKKEGVVISGFNPLATDIVSTRLMGFDYRKLKWIVNLIDNKNFNFYVDDVENIKIFTNNPEFQDIFKTNDKYLNFKPPPGWQGFIELV